jgi:hypothetical protein
VRVVPLPAWVDQTVQAHRKSFKPRPYSLPWEKTTGKLVTHNLLFRWTDDKILRARLYNEMIWRPGLVKAGIAPEPTNPGFTLRTYIHMLPDSHERAIRSIDARLFRPRAVAAAEL